MKLSKAVRLFIALLLVCAFIIPEGVSVSAASYKTGIYKINTQESPLNVRTCPSSENMKVGSIPKGTKVNVTFVSSNGWGKVVYGSVHGWISLEYCKYVGPAEEPSAEASSAGKTRTYGISSANLTWVTGWKQEFSKTSGLCTSSATASLLRRRQAAEGKAVTFTFGDVRAAMGGNPIPDKNGKYESCSSYFSDVTPFTHQDTATGAAITYYLKKETETTHSHNREYIADLIDTHPEGVVVYTKYGSSGKHAILISDYVRKKDGSLQFYAYDPANGTGRKKLEDTWIMTKISSVGAFFANVISIWYVQGDLTVDDGYFAYPGYEVIDSQLTVSKKKTYVYSESDLSSERIDKLAKGDTVDIAYRFTAQDGTEWCITSEGFFIEAERLSAR
ncbi:MAG: SH3 domain-containing protein [Lachnospiraceae bacterium]|nr:SH3 domain-containing protein [Lachnospiraceae bacterium]MBO4559262.1 SH3 domain-containing protein [Lachnospiraceae bacterium]